VSDCRADCPIPNGGDCPRHGVRKTATWVRLCRTREDYWRLWEAGRGPGRQSPNITPRAARTSLVRRVLTWGEAVIRWVAAGRPTRDDATVNHLAAICRGCCRFRDDHCVVCGCRVNQSRVAVLNKARMATEDCPEARWGLAAVDQWQLLPTARAPECPLTVVVTAFRRPALLARCLASVPPGVPVVVSIACPGPEEIAVLSSARRARPDLRVTATSTDLGCNELWLRGLYAAATPYVQILHDDDFLAPDYAAALAQRILPALGRVDWIVWDGQSWGVGPKGYHRQYHGPAGIHPSTAALPAMTARGAYARSPVVQVFRRDLAIRTLKECAEAFGPAFHTRPTMMVGNDLLLGLRHAAECFEFLYLDQALTRYGVWAGSETCAHRKLHSPRLVEIYDRTRDHFAAHPKPPDRPAAKIVHAVNLWAASGETKRRMAEAWRSWQRLYDGAAWVPCFVTPPDLARDSGSVAPDDPRRVPFLRDLLDAGCRAAEPEDLVVYSNADVGIVPEATSAIRAHLADHECGFTFRRDFPSSPAPRPALLDRQAVSRLSPYAGADLFCFRPAWWQRVRSQCPDWLVGNPTWDWGLRLFMAITTGESLDALRALPVGEHGRPLAIPDLIYHEWHDAPWTEVRANPSAQYNLTTTREWLARLFGPPAAWPESWRREVRY